MLQHDLITSLSFNCLCGFFFVPPPQLFLVSETTSSSRFIIQPLVDSFILKFEMYGINECCGLDNFGIDVIIISWRLDFRSLMYRPWIRPYVVLTVVNRGAGRKD